jgi:tetratricopeptide (TPR) repeat protein
MGNGLIQMGGTMIGRWWGPVTATLLSQKPGNKSGNSWGVAMRQYRVDTMERRSSRRRLWQGPLACWIASFLLLILLSGNSWAQSTLAAGKRALETGDFEKAAILLDEALVRYPTVREVYFLAATAHLKRGDVDAAIERMRKGLTYFASDPDYRLKLGSLLLEAGRPAEAARQLEHARRLDPFRLEIRQALGEAYLAQGNRHFREGDYGDAAKVFRQARQLLDDWRVLYNLGLAWLKAGQMDSALAAASDGLRQWPGQKEFLVLRAAALEKKGDVEALTETYEHLWQVFPDSLAIGLDLAQLYGASRQFRKAEALYDTLMDRYPEERQVYSAAAQYYEKLLDYEHVREIYGRLLRVYPGDREAQLAIARAWEAEGKWASAAQTYEQMLQVDGNDTELLANLVNAYREARLWTQMANAAERLKNLDPRNRQVWLTLGEAYRQSARFDEALHAFRTAAAVDSFWAKPWIEMGKIYEARMRPQQAVKAYQRAIFLGTAEPLPYHRLAMQMLAEKDTGAFRRYVERAAIKAVRAILQLEGNVRTQLKDGALFEPQRAVRMHGSIRRVREYEQILRESLEALRKASPETFETFLQEILSLFPQAKALWLYKGQMLEQMGRWSEAEETYRKILRLDVLTAEAHRGLARSLEARGRTAEAYREYLRILAFDFNDDRIYAKTVELAERAGRLPELISRFQQMQKLHPESALLPKYLEIARKRMKKDRAEFAK